MLKLPAHDSQAIGSADMQTKKLPYIHNDHIKELEILIDEFHNNKLRELKSFILPGGTLPSSLLHLCRAVTRRAERDLVTLKKVVPHLNQETLICSKYERIISFINDPYML